MGDVKKEKIEIMYFYSDLYESRRKLIPIVKKLQRKRPNIRIRLINVEDPENEDIAEIYSVKSIPLVIFLTPKGDVASRKSVPLSDEDTIEDIVERVVRGDLPKPEVNELKRRILEPFKLVSRRNELTQLIAEQIEGDILEADSEKEIYDAINLYVSVINHTISDLEDYRRILQKYMVRQKDFII
ncbi:MAG: thioredoxin family protein [Candidatus Bathyarchaeia archaeon]